MTEGGFGERAGDGTSIYIEVRREGELLASRLASVAPCQEDALFGDILSGRVPNDGSLPSFALAASWSGAPNPPEATGDSVPRTITGVDLCCGDASSRHYGKQVFAAQARDLIDSLVAKGSLAAGTPVEWDLAEGREKEAAPNFAVRVSREPLPLSRARLPQLARGEVRVEFDASLLDRLSGDFRRAGAVECAWLLVGGVDHDPDRSAAAIRAVTAVGIEMGRGGASQSHFAFQPGLFVEARERALRDFDGLVPIGWAHSHPPCEACPANPSCQSDTRFFSADDVEVHTSAFASPYMIALVVGKVATAPASEPGFHLYGWREGLVRQIEYQVAGRATG